MISYNKPYFTGKEIDYIKEAFNKQTSGNGYFTKKCHSFFQDKYGFKKVLLTTSCTDALEMASILIDIKPGDEVIMPSYTFVSTANPFILRGAKIVFADSSKANPNIDAFGIEALITENTKAVIVVHYAGFACEMDKIIEVVKKYNLILIEDAAQAIDSFYKGKPLGSFGNLSCFSFHETKNITSGEGGLLVINDERYIKRAEIIWEKGTNRSAFQRGEVSKYQWVDLGSSFLPSEIIAATLFAQLEVLEVIQNKRKFLWERYYELLKPFSNINTFEISQIPEFSSINGHIFYIICKDLKTRSKLVTFLYEKEIQALFHYVSLHNSEFNLIKHDGRVLENSDRYSDCLIRLPLHGHLPVEDQDYICSSIKIFFEDKITPSF